MWLFLSLLSSKTFVLAFLKAPAFIYIIEARIQASRTLKEGDGQLQHSSCQKVWLFFFFSLLSIEDGINDLIVIIILCIIEQIIPVNMKSILQNTRQWHLTNRSHCQCLCALVSYYYVISITLVDWINICRERSDELKDQRLHALETDDPTHEGIKIVPVEKACEFSTGSVLCICIVTWNMNGKVDSFQFSCL